MDWEEQDEQVGLGAPPQSELEPVIDYIKTEVGQGTEYNNGLVKVVLSDKGCYYEFVDLPGEFSGAIGSAFKSEFTGSSQALRLLDQIQQMILKADESNTREISLFVLYEREGVLNPQAAYLYQRISQQGKEIDPSTAGSYRPGTLPLFFKLKVDSDLAIPVLGNRKGVVFFVAHLTDQHLLVQIPHSGPELSDVSQAPGSRMIH